MNFRWFYAGMLFGSACSSSVRTLLRCRRFWLMYAILTVALGACVCLNAEVTSTSVSVGSVHILALPEFDDFDFTSLDGPSDSPTRNIDDLELEAFAYAEGDGDQKTCIVCLEEFAAGDIVNKLKCGHMFHPQCIYTWATYKPTCPACRAVFDE